MSNTLPVHEVFHSFQGEGMHVGRAAFFVRLYGCPLHCPWCDSAGTWSANYVPKHIQRLTANEIAQQAKDSCADFVVITGGEPAIHDLSELTAAIQKNGQHVHIETSGAFAVRGSYDWLTLSPKRAKLPLSYMANEWKLIVENAASILFWWQHKNLGQIYHSLPIRPIVWLHPEWSQKACPEVLAIIVEAVKTNPKVFRAGWQMHKNYRADLLDSRSAPSVPLGGDLALGY